ncbi:MAG: S1 RNA-binding domain-containing protein [Spirochaetes bacterium]|nr:S1 RNA-binding domain-containing protein [Spirochaetota bacterium]MBN2770454.1 S1 RNA-binding domain-containing protein [Spirochaetota bacterium]
MNDKIDPDFEDSISMDELLAESELAFEGGVLKGEVVSVDNEFAFINTGGKTEGRVLLSEFAVKPKPGEVVDVVVVNRRGGDGMSILSHRQAKQAAEWECFEKSGLSVGNDIKGKIVEARQNGAMVEFDGYRGFMPMSHAADIRVKDAVQNKTEFELRIIKIDPRKKSIIVSRRALVEEKKDESWKELLASVSEGDVVEGTVARIVNFGAFIDIGGFEALLHNNDLSWKKVAYVKDFLKIGDKSKFKVLSINKSDRKISLGLKQLKEDPWLSVKNRFSIGTVYNGTVTGVAHFGVFVELEEGVEGLVPASEIDWTKKNQGARNQPAKGDDVKVKILSIDSDEKTISLSIRQTIENPWKAIAKKYPVGTVVKGVIKNKMDFGLFIQVEEGIDAFVHVSEISWDDKVKNPLEPYKEGDTVSCKILSVNVDEMKIAAGIKQLERSPWEAVKEKFPPRSIVQGKITSVKSFGVFVKLDENVEGMIHISEVSKNKVDDLSELFKEGDTVEAVVLDVDIAKKKISLSIKNIEMQAEKEELSKILNAQSSNTASIGDLIKLKGEETENE